MGAARSPGTGRPAEGADATLPSRRPRQIRLVPGTRPAGPGTRGPHTALAAQSCPSEKGQRQKTKPGAPAGSVGLSVPRAAVWAAHRASAGRPEGGPAAGPEPVAPRRGSLRAVRSGCSLLGQTLLPVAAPSRLARPPELGWATLQPAPGFASSCSPNFIDPLTKSTVFYGHFLLMNSRRH